MAVVEELLHRGLAEEMRRTGTADEEDRDRVMHRVRHAADAVQEAGPLRDQHRRHPPGDAVIRVSHVDGLRLVLCLDPLELRLIDERVEQTPDGAPGDAEVVLHPRELEPRRDRVYDSHVPCLPAAAIGREVVLWQQILLLSTMRDRR